ncbi:Or9e94 [Eciton burchellii]|nr:Or9e94 [Eciton burchellii]
MNFVETKYLSLNRFLLLTLGLWPYKRSKFIHLQLIVLYGIVISFIIFQFTVFITAECSIHLIIEILAIACFFIFIMINFNSYCFNMNVVKHILEQLQQIYDELKDKSEIAIMQKYWGMARRNTEALTMILLCGILTCVFNTFLPHILDIISPTNESRTLSLHFMTEYFINQEKYFYLILIHKEVASCIGVTVIVATGAMNMLYLQHACGMFMIASYRIEQAILSINLSNNNIKNKDLTYMRVIYAVDMHRKAMRFVNYVMSAFHIYYFFDIAASVISVSLISFRVLEGVISGYRIEKLVSPFLFLITLYIFLFLANKTAQEITDHNNHIFVTICNVQWYIAPLHIQRLLLFLLLRVTKSFNVVIGGIFIASLEGFAMLVSTSISYFTVIYSAG